jgi:TonB family protein
MGIAKVIRAVHPDYSEEARRAGIQGSVALMIDVGADGKVQNVTVQRGLGYGLDEKAVEAARQWLFQPATRDGQPVSSVVNVALSFGPAMPGASSESVVANTGVTMPRVVLKVEPEYSEAARRAKFQGTVVLSVDVMPDGSAQNISVQRSLGLGLDEKAVEAVRKWRFQPGTRNGQAVTTTSTIEVNFRLNVDSAANQASAAPAQAAAGQAVPENGVYRVGGGVTAPALLRKVEPEYTEEARLAGYDGTVILNIEVGTDGFAQSIKVMRGLGLGLDQKAIEAVSKWQFKPGTRFGVPVPVAATIEVNFRLL